MALILREYEFSWRTPDERRSDTIATFEVPQHIDYQLLRGDELRIIVPAKANIVFDGSNITSTSNDVSNAAYSAPDLTFELPYFTPSNYYTVNELVEIVDSNGNSVTYSYDSSTGKFTISNPATTTFYIYYAPIGGEVKLVHSITGGVRSEITVHRSSTNAHILYDPGRTPPRIQKDELVPSRTFLEIKVYPRTIGGTAKYKFDPLLPDGSTSNVCMVELTLQRITQ
jgi:hypothetical protein